MEKNRKNQQVIFRAAKSMATIIFNRPETINSLTVEMIDDITVYLQEARENAQCKFILFYGYGAKGFCAGGDVRELAKKISENRCNEVNMFFEKEYALDLMIHEYPKPIVVIADGVTMGGGLGIAAGADIILVSECTRMAMPETKIGFFPDVGATGWLFSKCPKGYPEYLSLTGYDMLGKESVRLGLATHYFMSRDVAQVIFTLENYETNFCSDRKNLSFKIVKMISSYLDYNIPEKNDMDEWVAKYFAGKSDLREILDSLKKCGDHQKLCDGVFGSIAERSPTALVLTLKLLRFNERRPLGDVFASELKAAKFITRQPDYVEGIRARLIERNDTPRWKPDKIEQVDLSGLQL